MKPQDKATLYAAYKELERILKDGDNNDLPVGEYLVTGNVVTITLPDIVVEREPGPRKDGTIDKRATQNMYGWALVAHLANRLRRFNQWHTVRIALVEAIRDTLTNGTTLHDELAQIDATFAQQVDNVRTECQPPLRTEPTPRKLHRSGRQLAHVQIEHDSDTRY